MNKTTIIAGLTLAITATAYSDDFDLDDWMDDSRDRQREQEQDHRIRQIEQERFYEEQQRQWEDLRRDQRERFDFN